MPACHPHPISPNLGLPGAASATNDQGRQLHQGAVVGREGGVLWQQKERLASNPAGKLLLRP